MFLITQVNYLNKSETEVEFEILLIASPIKFDIDKTSIARRENERVRIVVRCFSKRLRKIFS